MVDVGVTFTTEGAGYGAGLTLINENNAAASAFTCSKVKIFIVDGIDGDVNKVGSFFGGAGTWENRDSAELGIIATGEEVTITGLSIEFQAGDFIGWFDTDGKQPVERLTSGHTAVEFKSGDHFGAGEVSGYTDLAGDAIYLFGDDTGAAAAAGFNVGSIIL